MRSAIADADTEQDKIVITRAFCTIEEDWVEAIEEGLVHIEKAIKEDRQFIRSNGEVVEIEKVKHVSKETVEHLARHSNLISRYEEGEDIIPDKLYTVERLNDYAIYENRFLYMLLCYLRDFITIRYNDILDLTNKYDATIDLNKKVSAGKEKMTYTLSMHDVRRDDKYLKEHNPAREVIDRIDLILKAVLAFLATPLMEDVAKAPMLKPPITKTNVLKMNNNFKGAMALYNYIVAYDKPGYTIETKVTKLAPFKSDLADEMAEAGALVSFLAYEHGLGIKQELKESYLKEEERLKAEELKKKAERIASLKRKLKASEITIEEYAIELERHNRALESEASRANVLTEQLYECKEENKRIAADAAAARADRERIKAEMEELKIHHFEQMEKLKAEHQDAMHALIMSHEEAIRAIEAQMAEELARHTEQMRELITRTEEQLADGRRECAEAVAAANALVEESRAEARAAISERDEMANERDISEARVKALGGLPYDHTDRESFNRLEREFNAFKKLYRQQWNKTKKKIFKKYFTRDYIRGDKNGEENKEEQVKEVNENMGKDNGSD